MTCRHFIIELLRKLPFLPLASISKPSFEDDLYNYYDHIVTFASCSYLAALASLLFTHSKTFSLLKLLISLNSHKGTHISCSKTLQTTQSYDYLKHETLMSIFIIPMFSTMQYTTRLSYVTFCNDICHEASEARLGNICIHQLDLTTNPKLSIYLTRYFSELLFRCNCLYFHIFIRK